MFMLSTLCIIHSYVYLFICKYIDNHTIIIICFLFSLIDIRFNVYADFKPNVDEDDHTNAIQWQRIDKLYQQQQLSSSATASTTTAGSFETQKLNDLFWMKQSIIQVISS